MHEMQPIIADDRGDRQSVCLSRGSTRLLCAKTTERIQLSGVNNPGDMAVARRLGLNLGAPHTCRCGATVDALGQHTLVCKQVPSRIARHQHLNDLVTRVLVSAGVPTTKEPVGLLRRDGKRPDGMTQIPWRSGKLLFLFPLSLSFLFQRLSVITQRFNAALFRDTLTLHDDPDL